MQPQHVIYIHITYIYTYIGSFLGVILFQTCGAKIGYCFRDSIRGEIGVLRSPKFEFFPANSQAHFGTTKQFHLHVTLGTENAE